LACHCHSNGAVNALVLAGEKSYNPGSANGGVVGKMRRTCFTTRTRSRVVIALDS
jgi:hypothetical protein